MSSQSGRRTPPRGGRPSGRSGPGRSAASRATAPRASVQRPSDATARPAATPVRPSAAARAKPRFTGRAAILVIVLAVLAVSYASSLRAYLQQRDHIESLQSGNVKAQAVIDDQEREIEQRADPQYIETQARARLGLVMPGETPYVVLDNGRPLEAESTLSNPDDIDPPTPRAWWDDTWQSVLVAGNPPKRTDPPPATRIAEPGGTP